MTDATRTQPPDDAHIGAVESETPAGEGQGNRNAPALDDQGLPADRTAICEDVLGAAADGTEG